MDLEVLLKEINLKAVRSSGPGGQHVNKTSTKVEVSLQLWSSNAFTEDEKELLKSKLASKISSEGNISLQCSETRSQHRNKTLVIQRLISLIEQHLKVAKPRKKSKPSKGAIEKRLKSKKSQALKKSNRRPPKLDQ